MKSKKIKQPEDSVPWMRYIGLGSQLMVALGFSIWAGLWLDRRTGISVPLLVWILPLLVIAVTIYKLVKETAADRNGKNKSR